MSRRVFAAIKISDGLQEQIADWQSAHAQFSVRWIASKNLHVTIVPPWQTDNIDSVITKLQTVAGVAPFALKFGSTSLGPDGRAPRLIWSEGQTPLALIELKNKIEQALGQPKQTRPFHTHITLARFKHERPDSIQSDNIPAENVEPIDWSETVSAFVLIESHLQPGGSDYEILETFPLD